MWLEEMVLGYDCTLFKIVITNAKRKIELKPQGLSVPRKHFEGLRHSVGIQLCKNLSSTIKRQRYLLVKYLLILGIPCDKD